MTRLCFFFLFSEEMGKEYKYLKNMFHIYQVRFRAPWWIMREKQGSFWVAVVALSSSHPPEGQEAREAGVS